MLTLTSGNWLDCFCQHAGWFPGNCPNENFGIFGDKMCNIKLWGPILVPFRSLLFAEVFQPVPGAGFWAHADPDQMSWWRQLSSVKKDGKTADVATCWKYPWLSVGQMHGQYQLDAIGSYIFGWKKWMNIVVLNPSLPEDQHRISPFSVGESGNATSFKSPEIVQTLDGCSWHLG